MSSIESSVDWLKFQAAFLVSYDVTALFTNVLLDESIYILADN